MYIVKLVRIEMSELKKVTLRASSICIFSIEALIQRSLVCRILIHTLTASTISQSRGLPILGVNADER